MNTDQVEAALPDKHVEMPDDAPALDDLRQIAAIIGPSPLSVVEHVRQLFSAAPTRRDVRKETRPPTKYAHLQHHWLTSERSLSPCMSEWLNDCWHSAGEADPISPAEMRRRGWEYGKPAEYDAGPPK